MIELLNALRRLTVRRDDSGAMALEYAIVGSLIAAVIAVTVGLLGLHVDDLFASVEFPA
jgi:Flp pilus assembly pilin Flp